MKILVVMTSLLMIVQICYPVSVVYNMRILQTTNQRASHISNLRPSIGSLVFIEQFRERRTINSHEHFDALLGSYVYTARPFYIRTDFAFGHVNSKINNVKFSRTQSDDIYLAGGYTHQMTERSNLTGSLILGIPTHRDTVLQGIQFGTGHIGVGAQLDGLFALRSETPQTILTAVRFLHFIPRSASTCLTGQRLNFCVDIGNLVDLFIAYQVNLGCNRNHRLMTGYNPQFLFNASISPQIPALQNFSAIGARSNFFASYVYFFPIGDHISGLVAGFSYGFDHLPKCFGIKNQETFWIGWGVNF